MEPQYQIFKIVPKVVQVPSTDQYARHGDSQEAMVSVLEPQEAFKVEAEAVEHLEKLRQDVKDKVYGWKYTTGDYIILPIYTI